MRSLNKLARLSPVYLGLLMSFACSKSSGGGSGSGHDADASGTDLPATPLAGTIDGKPWSLATGIASTSPGGSDQITLKLSELTQPRPCSPFAWPDHASERLIYLSAAAAPGFDDRGEASGKSLTIEVRKAGEDADNLVGFGALQIDEVTRAEVKGRLNVRYDGANAAKGAFTVRRCTDEFADPKADFVADAQPDAALVGTWSGPIGASEDWVWTLSFAAAGTATAQLKIPVDQVLEDADETWQTDSGVNPHRLHRKVTSTRIDTNNFEALGSEQYCVYGVPPGETKLTVACSSSYYPAELPTADGASMVLSKVP